MSKAVVSLCIGVIAGYSMSLLRGDAPATIVEGHGRNDALASVGYVCDTQRGEALDRALKVERDARDLLLAEIDELESEIEHLESRRLATESSVVVDWLQIAWADLASAEEPVDRQQRLIDAGFDPARAAWVLRRETQLRLESIRDRGTADSDPMDFLESRLAGRKALREEIGDFEYERYLAATGQSTAVAVTEVLSASPAQDAGLHVGDTIIDYDGVRVFNMIDLANEARKSDANTLVVVNIRRDGAPMQLVLPRGPLGISGGKPTPH